MKQPNEITFFPLCWSLKSSRGLQEKSRTSGSWSVMNLEVWPDPSPMYKKHPPYSLVATWCTWQRGWNEPVSFELSLCMRYCRQACVLDLQPEKKKPTSLHLSSVSGKHSQLVLISFPSFLSKVVTPECLIWDKSSASIGRHSQCGVCDGQWSLDFSHIIHIFGRAMSKTTTKLEILDFYYDSTHI